MPIPPCRTPLRAGVLIVVDENQDVSDLHTSKSTARTFKGTVSGVSGTFTCAASADCAAVESTPNAGGQLVVDMVLTRVGHLNPTTMSNHRGDARHRLYVVSGIGCSHRIRIRLVKTPKWI